MTINKNRAFAFNCFHLFLLKQVLQTTFSAYNLNEQSLKQNLPLWHKKTFLQSQNCLSGEIFKENFKDVFYTNLEQSAFSLNLTKLRADNTPWSFEQNSPIYDVLHKTFFRKKQNNQLVTSLKSLFAENVVLSTNNMIKVGDYVRCGDKIGDTKLQTAEQKQQKQNKEKKIAILFGASGKVVKISKTQITLQKTQPILFYSQADLNVKQSEWVERGTPVLTLTHQTLVTGDIVQGIPRIEQLFEAFTSPSTGVKEGVLHDTLHSQVRDIFRKNWFTNALPIAVRQSLETIQQILVESIQKVYLSQGVLIADKHIEIVVRQMTSKVQILDSGSTGFLLEEIVPIRQVENANISTPGKKALYAPAVVGLTSAALSSDSFISAASFQETTRVLSRDAVVGKSDFLKGLKEKVVIGDLISAGTGLDLYFVYTLLPNNANFTNLAKLA